MTSPPLARETGHGREYYNFKTQEVAISVTTALKSFHKKEIESWKLGMAANFANDNWDEMTSWHPSARKDAMIMANEDYTAEKGRVGNLVHETVESIIKGIPVEIPKEISGYVSSFSKFVMDKRPEFLESEFTVWNRTLGYAGTADALALIDGEAWCLDWKSGKSVHSEFGMQLSALKHAEFLIRPDCTEEPIPRIDRLGVVHLRPRSWHFVPVEKDEECFRAFKGALELARWKDEVADHVLGEAA